MSLPSRWIDKIFEKLTLVYGQDFLRRWQDIDLELVKADWAHELAGYEAHPAAVAYALANLPDRPPTVLEFRRIAMRAPAASAPRLQAPRADPALVREQLAKARALLSRAVA